MEKQRETITLTARIDSGEGNLTSHSRDITTELSYRHGALWAMDVLGDWKGELDYYYDEAAVRWEASLANTRSDLLSTPEEFCADMWRRGYGSADWGTFACDYYSFAAPTASDDFIDTVLKISEDDEAVQRIKDVVMETDVAKIIETIFKEQAAEEAGEISEVNKVHPTYENQIHHRVALAMYERGLMDGQPMAASA